MDIFEGLSERQREAVETIDDDLEIIACAGDRWRRCCRLVGFIW